MRQQTGRGRAYWTPIIEAFLGGPDMSQREFCRHRGVSYRNFGRWLRKLRAEREKPASLQRRFVEVELPSPPSAPLVRVQLGRVAVDFDTMPPPAWILRFRLAAARPPQDSDLGRRRLRRLRVPWHMAEL